MLGPEKPQTPPVKTGRGLGHLMGVMGPKSKDGTAALTANS